MWDLVLSGPTPIEYLESTGTQYIDTEIYPNGATKIELDYAGVQNQTFVIGSRINYNNSAFYFTNGGTQGTNYGQWFLNYGNSFQTPSYVNDNNRHVLSISNTIIFDNSTIATFTSGSFNCPYYMYAFASNMAGTVSYGKYKVYSCKIYNGNTLVRDFIPVRVGQVGYLYDKVSGQLFGNAGTGNFVLGPDL